MAHRKDPTGGCLCGGVRYRVAGALRDVVNCYCGQCRKTSGHHVAAARAVLTDFHIERDDTLTWYHSSAAARRGFCHTCGGNLFWQAHNGATATEATISIMAGTLDTSTDLKTTGNLYAQDASDYQIIREF